MGLKYLHADIQCQLRQIHRSGLVDGLVPADIGCHVAHYKVCPILAKRVPQFPDDVVITNVTLDELDCRQGIHGQQVHGDDPDAFLEFSADVLAPAAGRGAEVDADHVGFQNSLFFVYLFELVYGPRPPPIPTRLVHIGIALLAVTPTAAAVSRFAHGVNRIRNTWHCATLLHSRRMTLSESQKKFLRGLGHTLKPVIMVGEAGLTDKLHAEFESTIAHHELIKIRVRVGDRGARDIIVNELPCTGTMAREVAEYEPRSPGH